MGPAAALVVVLGVVGIIYSFMERAKAQRVTKAPLIRTGSLAMQASGSAVSVEGNVVCPQPLIAPFSGTPCLFYSLKCTAEWKEGETKKTRELSNLKSAAQFLIDDGSGPAWINASQGGTFEPTQSKSEAKGAGLLGGITGKDLMFGQYVVTTSALGLGTKYEVKEEVLPLTPRLYVNGVLNGGVISEPTGMQSLIISHKTREHLLASSLKTAKLALVIGISAVVIGTALGVASRLIA